MKLLILLTIFLASACTLKDNETVQVDRVNTENDKSLFYCARLTDDYIHNRCDRGTFANMANAFCAAPPYRNSRHEWKPGEHHRDVYPNKCYPEDSKSECSPDYFVTKFHEWLTNKNLKGVNDAITYLDGHDWKCGEGPSELTNVRHLRPHFYLLQGYLNGETRFVVNSNEVLDEIVKKHNAYLVALSIYLGLRINGGVLSPERAFLESINDGTCVFEALIARVTDGDQDKALDAMEGFPRYIVPTGDSYAGWGSAPPAIIQITCAAILDGL